MNFYVPEAFRQALSDWLRRRFDLIRDHFIGAGLHKTVDVEPVSREDRNRQIGRESSRSPTARSLASGLLMTRLNSRDHSTPG
ncbi:MAG: hypothetical protein C4527_27125 [Candidatus Omnitrophota bacterium]|jgi:hypothetical protein|nr:MAG: hypothetical protein C4527_27125 [Candidatus Omnitrophota bacterium]